MKHVQSGLLTLAFVTSLFAGAQAAGMGGSASGQIKPWLGTWSCKAGHNPHTATFSPIFGGKAMTISETGAVPSQETVSWDSTHKKWIDQYADASGMTMTSIGTPSGKSIDFKQVYPSGDAAIFVTMASKNTYTTVFSVTMNGKKMVEHETCTRT